MSIADGVCTACRAGLHDECADSFTLSLADDQPCCCNGHFSLVLLVREMHGEEMEAEAQQPKAKGGGGGEAPAQHGDSGYIHPDAYIVTKDLGTLTDPVSTGRKAVDRMYRPFPEGLVCEWAGLASAGGGVYPIVGCLGNPATDLHHGPDKNTLNNAKGSMGFGVMENVHRICSSCHNTWHALNNPTYPDYDRIEDQAQPWFPEGPFPPDGPWTEHDGETMADPDTLYRVARERDEKSRKEDRRERGRRNNGGAGPDRTGPGTVDDDPDGP